MTQRAASEAILWNIPEQKTGKVAILGGNAQSFAQIVKTAEYFTPLPVGELKLVLPDALKNKLPPLPELYFAPSTPAGSLAKSDELAAALDFADVAVLAGDFSKNAATAVALAEAMAENPDTPTVWAKDTVNLLENEATRLLEQNQITILATVAQLQKLLRAMYYPKMLLLSMPMQPVKEVLRKFTVSYPKVVILTLHQGQILVASAGEVATTPLEKTGYTPLSLWTTDLAVKVTALQLWNSKARFEATRTAVEWNNEL